MIITYHTPDGQVTIDTLTVTDEELEALGMDRSKLPPEPLVFTASPPGTAIGKRLNNIEDFLREAYPG
ncbi:hypothetical protein ES708_11323 [subsurface metagenome]